MIELAELLGKTLKPQRTVIFIAFTSEESGLLGSKYYVKNIKRFPAKKVIGVLNFDTVGRLFNNKLFVLGSNSAREWKFIFMGASYVTGVESEMVTQDLDASDQKSFIEIGVPGVQFFSGANEGYHKPSDTPDKIDAAGLVKVAAFAREGILYLADRLEPLTFQGQVESETKHKFQPAKEKFQQEAYQILHFPVKEFVSLIYRPTLRLKKQDFKREISLLRLVSIRLLT